MITFVPGLGFGLAWAFNSNNLFKSCSKVKMNLVSQDIGHFTKPISS